MSAQKTNAVSDSVSSRVARALKKAASRKYSGFTLVELIVVITILAILATIGFLALSGYSQDAKDSALKANVRSVVSAISSESALTGNSPRYYVVHDTGAALTGAFVYVDGPVALTGGAWDVSGTNYSAGNPDYAKLKLNAGKFNVALRNFPYGLPQASAAYDAAQLSVGAMDYSSSVTASGPKRSSSFFQVAGINPATKAVTVNGNYPGTSLSGSVAGLIKDSTSTGALVDAGTSNASSSSSSSSSGGGASCPTGFVAIPGSSSVTVGGTSAPSGWCVAKFEMSPNASASWTQDAATYFGWRYDSASKPDPKVVSKSGSYPITYVTRDEAEAACSTQLANQAGTALSNGHLLSAELWKKIADDVAAQNVNWSGNSPGSGNMSRGHASWTPYNTLQGLASDTVTNPVAANFYDRRTWALSNGAVIHDFAGNVWEWYYDTHANASYGWTELSAFATGKPTFGGIQMRPSTTSWNSSQGIGQTYFNDTAGGVVATGTTYAALFGGSWGDTSNAGVFTSVWHTYSPSSTRYNNVGFRCIVPAQ